MRILAYCNLKASTFLALLWNNNPLVLFRMDLHLLESLPTDLYIKLCNIATYINSLIRKYLKLPLWLWMSWIKTYPRILWSESTRKIYWIGHRQSNNQKSPSITFLFLFDIKTIQWPLRILRFYNVQILWFNRLCIHRILQTTPQKNNSLSLTSKHKLWIRTLSN